MRTYIMTLEYFIRHVNSNLQTQFNSSLTTLGTVAHIFNFFIKELYSEWWFNRTIMKLSIWSNESAIYMLCELYENISKTLGIKFLKNCECAVLGSNSHLNRHKWFMKVINCVFRDPSPINSLLKRFPETC